MTFYDTSHWTIIDGKCGLLLFAQSLEELLATHGHDSHKVPALNFHYICIETLTVIDLIENNIIDKGNLIPLWAEMNTLFQQDWVAQKFLGKDLDAIFTKKNGKGEYGKQPIKIEASKDVDSYLPLLKKGLNFIVAELSRNNQYYHELIRETKARIEDSGNDILKLDVLCDLTRIIASELINKGFRQPYIYDCIKHTFFNTSHQVCAVDAVDDFFNCFSSSFHKYSVYLPLNSVKQKRALEDYALFDIAENIYEIFDPSIPYILKYKCQAKDPYGARENALNLINFCLSVNQFIKHNKYDYNPKYTEVFDTETKEVTFIRKSEPPIAQVYNNYEEIKVNDLLDTCLKLSAGPLQVLQLHSAALISKNIDNQLINLWTAVEVAVPIVRKDGLSRINQISNILTAALSKDYFLGLIHQLILDVKMINSNLLDKIEEIDYPASLDLKFLAVLVLQKYTDIYNEISSTMMDSAPLLASRMHRYKVKWSNCSSIKKVYQAHCERLSQQIMRIYRTRNMLVHDGSSLPYTGYVLQNLHHYVDFFIRFLGSYYKLGYESVPIIVEAIQFQEQLYLQSLSSGDIINENNLKAYFLCNYPQMR